MKETNGDLFALAKGGVLVVTTNGFVKKSGEAVMGRGCAKQLADAWPPVKTILGTHIHQKGNTVAVLLGAGEIKDSTYKAVVSFPVKHNWWEQADLSLIEASAKQLKNLADSHSWESIFIPRPGCGNGKLTWSQVQPVLLPYFDDRFTLVDFATK